MGDENHHTSYSTYQLTLILATYLYIPKIEMIPATPISGISWKVEFITLELNELFQKRTYKI